MGDLRITKNVVYELAAFAADLTDGVIDLEAAQNDGSGLKYKIAGLTLWFKGPQATKTAAAYFAGAIDEYYGRLSPESQQWDEQLMRTVMVVIDRHYRDRRIAEGFREGRERAEVIYQTTRCWQHGGQDHRTDAQRAEGVEVTTVMPRATTVMLPRGICTGHAYDLKLAGGRTCAWIDESQVAGPGGYVPSLVTENQPGHSPLVGQGAQAQPWYWGQTVAEAKAACDQYNARKHISPRARREIVNSSMMASIGQRHRAIRAGSRS